MKLLMENWRKFLREEAEVGGAPSDDELRKAAEWLGEHVAEVIEAANAGDYTDALALLVANLNSSAGVSPAVRYLLSRGNEDMGGEGDEIIQVEFKNIVGTELHPTQGVIDLFKSVGYNGSVPKSLAAVLNGRSSAPPILAAGSGGKYFIIDGHHRWSGATVFNLNCEIPANVISMDPYQALLLSQVSIAAYLGAGKKLPFASAKKGRSIIGPSAMTPAAVYKELRSNIGVVIDKWAGLPFWNPEILQIVKQSGYGRDMPAAGIPASPEEKAPQQDLQEFNQMEMQMVSDRGLKKIAANCGRLAQKNAEKGPPREIMPQFDPKVGGPDFKQVEKEFEDGSLNWKPEFLPKRLAAKAAEE